MLVGRVPSRGGVSAFQSECEKCGLASPEPRRSFAGVPLTRIRGTPVGLRRSPGEGPVQGRMNWRPKAREGQSAGGDSQK
jgi:hypothetical protein